MGRFAVGRGVNRAVRALLVVVRRVFESSYDNITVYSASVYVSSRLPAGPAREVGAVVDESGVMDDD